MSDLNLVLRCMGAAVFGFAVGLLVLSDSESKVASMEPALDMAAFKAPSASPMSMTCPVLGPKMSIQAMQSTLRKAGVAPSPWEKFALTSYAATRDVSMAAQVKEEFNKLPPGTQAEVRKLSKDMVVRAAAVDAKDMAGITAPMGLFDPAGFSKKNDGKLAGYRRAELKHGRVCMLASLGILVGEKFHPFFDSWGEGSFVSAAATHFSDTARTNFWPAFWCMAAGHEFATQLKDYPGKEEADYGFDPLDLKPSDPAELKELQNKELNNGRLAMIATAGILAQELVTGKSIWEYYGK